VVYATEMLSVVRIKFVKRVKVTKRRPITELLLRREPLKICHWWVCLSVCPSVCPSHSGIVLKCEQNYSVVVSSSMESPNTLVFAISGSFRNSKEVTSNEGVK